MTEYSDVPQVNTLYQESQQVDAAIALIDAGGTVGNFMVRPPPPTEEPAPVMMGISITVPPGPPNEPLMADLRVLLVERQNAILAEMAALGVTATPPAAT